jgi:hypothetical protein
MIKNWNQLPLAAALGAALAFTSAAGFAEPAQPTAAPAPAASAKDGENTLTDEQREILQAMIYSEAGRESMSYIVAARQSLEADKPEDASKLLDGARHLLTELRTRMTADMGEQAAASPQFLVPIYSEVGITADIQVTDELKEQLQGLQSFVARGDHDKVIDGLKATGVGMVYTFVDLPVSATIEQVQLAMDALAAKDTDAANKALAAVEAGLVSDTVAVGMEQVEQTG